LRLSSTALQLCLCRAICPHATPPSLMAADYILDGEVRVVWPHLKEGQFVIAHAGLLRNRALIYTTYSASADVEYFPFLFFQFTVFFDRWYAKNTVWPTTHLTRPLGGKNGHSDEHERCSSPSLDLRVRFRVQQKTWRVISVRAPILGKISSLCSPNLTSPLTSCE